MQKQYTPKEAADKLRISHSHVMKMCRDNTIEATKIGRKWLISESELTRISEGK